MAPKITVPHVLCVSAKIRMGNRFRKAKADNSTPKYTIQRKRLKLRFLRIKYCIRLIHHLLFQRTHTHTRAGRKDFKNILKGSLFTPWQHPGVALIGEWTELSGGTEIWWQAGEPLFPAGGHPDPHGHTHKVEEEMWIAAVAGAEQADGCVGQQSPKSIIAGRTVAVT